MAQLVLGFGSGHDLTVREFKPCMGFFADGVQSAWDSLSPSLSTPPLLMHTLSQSLTLKINK